MAQPFFDADGPLARDGFKLYWSDWRGHSFCMSTLQLHRALESLRAQGLVRGFKIAWNARIASSADRAVLPIAAPAEQHDYDAAKHGHKPVKRFRYPVYRELRALIDTGEADRRLIEAQARLDDVVIASEWPERPSLSSRASSRMRAIASRLLAR